MNAIVHPQALCESQQIGDRTRIWAFAHVLAGASIGADCNICDGVFIENEVIVGDNVTVKCGVQLWDGVTLEDNVFVGPNVTFTNDMHPRSKAYLERPLRTLVELGASIGANATILPGVRIGRNAMIGAGAVVTTSVPPNAIVVGNPARITGYVGATAPDMPQTRPNADRVPDIQNSRVKGVQLRTLKTASDMRGTLCAIEFTRDLPFEPKRQFFVYQVSTTRVRGEHAHHECHQFLVAAHGSVKVVADDGTNREEFTLDRPDTGVYLPPMTWGVQYQYSPDAILMVLASHHYDADDYIRDYSEFLRLVRVAAT